ncbi:Gfo/Idh/MocA family oxidoreductase [Haloarchaeobius sp. TZWSO28]|uniref:Gfo/Idh/MocA family oxidoreductase n=1 Tax=Haloarchaeobius sp. TZWSO28 TaxID=3446119 RepID=UPI003EB7C1E8
MSEHETKPTDTGESAADTGSEQLRIGILGLDTSHAETFADELVESEEATVSAVWDGGEVRDDSYLGTFAETYDAETYADPVSMIDDVDAVMVLTVDWDTHVELAVPFLEAGIPTFVDKVVAGTVDDVDALADAAVDTPIFGGSSIPFHPSVQTLPFGQKNRTLYAAGYNDPFYYGVHIVDSARMVAGADWECVRPRDEQEFCVEVTFENGTTALLQFDGNTESPAFGFLDVADVTRTARVSVGDRYDEMRASFFDAFVATVRGERDDTGRVLDAARLQLAIHAALETGATVTRGDDKLDAYHADGTSYARAYATDTTAAVRGNWK